MKEQEIEVTAQDILNKMLADLSDKDVKDIIELAKQVSEKHLNKDDELYQFFHKENFF